MSATNAVVAVVNDLMFGSKVSGSARHVGVPVVFARSPAALMEHAAGAALVLIDLETRWLDVGGQIRLLKSDPATAATMIVAFGPHVRTELLQEAHAAGADRVMARSAFVAALPALLAGVRDS